MISTSYLDLLRGGSVHSIFDPGLNTGPRIVRDLQAVAELEHDLCYSLIGYGGRCSEPLCSSIWDMRNQDGDHLDHSSGVIHQNGFQC